MDNLNLELILRAFEALESGAHGEHITLAEDTVTVELETLEEVTCE